MQNKDSQIVDLTHSLTTGIPSWSIDCRFHLLLESDYQDCQGTDLFRTQKITTNLGIGTHIDSPAHCFPEGKTVDLLNLGNLITNCAVIKVDDVAHDKYLIMPDEVEKYENNHEKIQPNTFVIFYTGWDQYWDNPEKYNNNLRFPSIHEDTARFLLERNIAGLGIDTLSPDAMGESFPVHRVILGSGKYLIENVANARNLPPSGAKIFVMPMKIKEGTEAPVRLVAFI